MIIQYSIVRSGSTLLFNILRTIYDGKIIKTHNYDNSYDNEMIISSWRDPIECIISQNRVIRDLDGYEPIRIVDCIGSIRDVAKNLYDWKTVNYRHKNMTIIGYNDLINNLENVASFLCRRINDIELTDSELDNIKKLSIDNVINSQNDMTTFKEFDKDTLIHGKHISTNSMDDMLHPEDSEHWESLRWILHNGDMDLIEKFIGRL